MVQTPENAEKCEKKLAFVVVNKAYLNAQCDEQEWLELCDHCINTEHKPDFEDSCTVCVWLGTKYTRKLTLVGFRRLSVTATLFFYLKKKDVTVIIELDNFTSARFETELKILNCRYLIYAALRCAKERTRDDCGLWAPHSDSRARPWYTTSINKRQCEHNSYGSPMVSREENDPKVDEELLDAERGEEVQEFGSNVDIDERGQARRAMRRERHVHRDDARARKLEDVEGDKET